MNLTNCGAPRSRACMRFPTTSIARKRSQQAACGDCLPTLSTLIVCRRNVIKPSIAMVRVRPSQLRRAPPESWAKKAVATPTSSMLTRLRAGALAFALSSNASNSIAASGVLLSAHYQWPSQVVPGRELIKRAWTGRQSLLYTQ